MDFFYQRGRSKKVNKVVSEILLLRAACRSETNLLKLYFRTVISGFGSSNKSAFTVMLDSNYCWVIRKPYYTILTRWLAASWHANSLLFSGYFRHSLLNASISDVMKVDTCRNYVMNVDVKKSLYWISIRKIKKENCAFEICWVNKDWVRWYEVLIKLSKGNKKEWFMCTSKMILIAN